MSESLPVELNGESVHAIDAPESFTAEGPFHLELSNAGGAVHVHVHLSDALSRAARIQEVNHYVESGETTRVPVGTVSGRGSVTGHIEIVSGYGAERERVEVTVTTDGPADHRGNSRNRRSDAGPNGDTGSARTVSAAGGGSSTGRRMERSATGMGVRGLANRSLPAVPTSVDVAGREGLAFVGLAAVAVVVGVAVILTVDSTLVSLVVAGVVTAVVAVTGWLLLR